MRDLEFDGYWEGAVCYTCDCCGKEERFRFDGESEAKNYKGQKKQLQDNGWIFTQVYSRWHDFCSEECRNRYIRKNTF